MAKLFANSGDPDQTPRSAASDLGLHCLPNNILGVSRLQRVNNTNTEKAFLFLSEFITMQRVASIQNGSKT